MPSNGGSEENVMAVPDDWLAQTSMTEPGALARQCESHPADVARLSRIVQGLLIHGERLALYGADASAFGAVSRTTLPVGERLAALVASDGLRLEEAREPTHRSVGTCRDFALTLCAFLRAKGTAARLRCGFASYFRHGWEDHWVCEYWCDAESRWRLADAQLDATIAAARATGFDAADMPRDVFLTAGDAWLRCRTGEDDPERFGHGETRGLWFMAVNVIRDTLAVNNHEVSAWDSWRDASPELRAVPEEELAELDRLARSPDDRPPPLAPPWLGRTG